MAFNSTIIDLSVKQSKCQSADRGKVLDHSPHTTIEAPEAGSIDPIQWTTCNGPMDTDRAASGWLKP
jgi:hypothetical protein